jgi:hypothetical protein
MWPFKKKKQPPIHQRRKEDYEKLGKQVAALYDHLNPDRRGLYRTAFLKGLVTGLGGVIGATIVVAVLAWILTLTGRVPFLGPISDDVRQTLQKQEQKDNQTN